MSKLMYYIIITVIEAISLLFGVSFVGSDFCNQSHLQSHFLRLHNFTCLFPMFHLNLKFWTVVYPFVIDIIFMWLGNIISMWSRFVSLRWHLTSLKIRCNWVKHWLKWKFECFKNEKVMWIFVIISIEIFCLFLMK